MAVIAAFAVNAAINTAAIVAADRLTQVSVCLAHIFVIVMTQNVAAADAKLILPRMSSIESRS